MERVCFLLNSRYSVGISQGRLQVRHDDGSVDEEPIETLDRVVLFGNAQVTTQALKECLKSGVEVQYYTQAGRYLGAFRPVLNKNVNRRMRQYQIVSSPERRLQWSQALLQGKICSEKLEYRRITDNGWHKRSPALFRELIRYERKIPNAQSIGELMGIEGSAARCYFQLFGASLPKEWSWHGREYHPVPDAMNALLSLTYSMTAGVLERQCMIHGLDGSLSFLHRTGYGAGGLVTDLLEPLRASVCDHFVLRLLYEHKVKPQDFAMEEDGYRMTDGGFRRYLKQFREHLEPRCEKLSERLLKEFYSALDSEDGVPDFTAIQPTR